MDQAVENKALRGMETNSNPWNISPMDRDGWTEDLEVPDSETRRGFDVIDEYFAGVGSGMTGQIVFEAEQGVDAPEVRQAMARLFEVAAAEGVVAGRGARHDRVDGFVVQRVRAVHAQQSHRRESTAAGGADSERMIALVDGVRRRSYLAGEM